MKHFSPIETRSAIPLETRDAAGDEADPIEAATEAVNELRTAATEHRTALDARLAALTGRLDTIEQRNNRPGAGQSETPDEAMALERRAFANFARHGREAMELEEVRALRVSDDTAGGYLAPAQFMTELLRDIVEYSPVRMAARVASTTAGSVVFPTLTGRPTAKWVGEIEPRPKDEPTFGQTEIAVHEAAVYTDVSNWLLEDAAMDIEQLLRDLFAEEFGRLESEAFVAGNGIKKPLGFMSDPRVPVVANGSTSAISTDALIDLYYSLPAQYRRRGSWMLNSGSTAALRKLKDADGRYLWQEALTGDQPATLLGRPVIDAPDMPEIAADEFPIAFGDFAVGYRIFDRVNLSVLRDPYSVAENGLVRFHARRRVGGAVVRPNALRKLRMAAA